MLHIYYKDINIDQYLQMRVKISFLGKILDIESIFFHIDIIILFIILLNIITNQRIYFQITVSDIKETWD